MQSKCSNNAMFFLSKAMLFMESVKNEENAAYGQII